MYGSTACRISPDDAARHDGFTLNIMIEGSWKEIDKVDPAGDWLYVDFHDEPLVAGDNWLDHTVRYVRVR